MFRKSLIGTLVLSCAALSFVPGEIDLSSIPDMRVLLPEECVCGGFDNYTTEGVISVCFLNSSQVTDGVCNSSEEESPCLGPDQDGVVIPKKCQIGVRRVKVSANLSGTGCAAVSWDVSNPPCAGVSRFTICCMSSGAKTSTISLGGGTCELDCGQLNGEFAIIQGSGSSYLSGMQGNCGSCDSAGSCLPGIPTFQLNFSCGQCEANT